MLFFRGVLRRANKFQKTMKLKKSHEICGVMIGAIFLFLRIPASEIHEAGQWMELTSMAVVLLLIAITATFGSLILGMKFDQRITGLIGFLLSAIVFPFVPSVVASLVILYRVVRRPLLLTAAWTGIAAVMTAAPIISYRMSGSGDLAYAGGYGLILLISLCGSVFFTGISFTSIIHHLIRVKWSKGAGSHDEGC